jgi:hypothetical protein
VDDNSKVTVRLDEDGGLAGLDIEGEIDRTQLVEETRPSVLPSLGEDAISGVNQRLPGLG